MKHFHTILISFILGVAFFVPTPPAHAATTADLLAQIQYLKAQLQSLEQQLLLQSTAVSTPTNCYTDTYGTRYCTVQSAPLTTFSTFTSTSDIDNIEVSFVGDIAQVRVNFNRGDPEYYAFEADTESQVATLLAPALRLPFATTLQLITRTTSRSSRTTRTDIRRIAVTFDRNDADVVVRFRDGDTDRFTLRNVDRDRDEVIQLLANRYDESRSTIRDLTDFSSSSTNNSDIRSIDVRFFGDDADILVRFRNGTTERFTLRNVDDDEDEVISRLADRYDMSKRDIEDVIEFD